MAYTCLLQHIVFCPKHRAPAITLEHEAMLYRYIWGVVKGVNGILYRIGGMPDHVHLFVQLPPTLTVADFVREVKLASGRYLKAHHQEFPLFQGWGASYCAVSHSRSEISTVVEYIRNQKEHHRKTSFQEELLQWMHEAGIDADEKYLLND